MTTVNRLITGIGEGVAEGGAEVTGGVVDSVAEIWGGADIIVEADSPVGVSKYPYTCIYMELFYLTFVLLSLLRLPVFVNKQHFIFL